jgi:hypothetical protein
MGFKVIWMRGPLTMGAEAFEDLPAATTYATDHIDDMQARFGATAVKVVDEGGMPHFLRSLSRS